jgi:endonuclease/exonuclease/phosphatase family metal-dependent hydrolase
MKKIFVSIFFLYLISVAASAQLRIVAYNVGAFSKYSEDSTHDIAKMMHEAGADAVAVCELDSCNRRHATFQLEDFAEALGGWDYRFGAAMKWAGGAYGTGVVTDTEVVDAFNIELPESGGHEPRVCVVAETETYVIAAAHLDHSRDRVRIRQARRLTNSLRRKYGSSDKPVFLCGDLNATPKSRLMKRLSKDWDVLSEQAPTYPADTPKECIDYILALKNRARYKVVETAVLTQFESADVTKMSDHLPVFVEVMIK